jgi:hypothetical protein
VVNGFRFILAHEEEHAGDMREELKATPKDLMPWRVFIFAGEEAGAIGAIQETAWLREGGV